MANQRKEKVDEDRMEEKRKGQGEMEDKQMESQGKGKRHMGQSLEKETKEPCAVTAAHLNHADWTNDSAHKEPFS